MNILVVVGVIVGAVIVFLGIIKSRDIKDYMDIDKVSKDRSGRIDVLSQDMEFELLDVSAGGTTSTKFSHAHWLPVKDKKKYWFVEAGVGYRWENIWLEFTAGASGYILVNIRGSYYENIKKYHHDVWVDDYEVEGIQVENGGFEMIGPNGKPAYWGWTGSKVRYSTDGTQAHTDKCCVLVWHDIPLVQRIEVEKGKRYKVKVWFKAYTNIKPKNKDKGSVKSISKA
jgi:hypothetical protein